MDGLIGHPIASMYVQLLAEGTALDSNGSPEEQAEIRRKQIEREERWFGAIGKEKAWREEAKAKREAKKTLKEKAQ